jgi:hypothetical protein
VKSKVLPRLYGKVLQPSKQVNEGQELLRLSAGGDKHGKQCLWSMCSGVLLQ